MAWHLFGQASPQSPLKPESTKVQQELIKLEDDWNNALVKGDVVFLNSVIAEDYMDTDPGGSVENKAQSLADLKTGDLKYSSAVNDQYKVHVYGDAAVLNYRSSVKGQFQGKDISGQYRITDTWVKLTGKWQCVSAHLSIMIGEK